MDFQVAYTTDESRIATALRQGRIDTGDMVLVTETGTPYGSLVIIDDKGRQIKVAGNIRKFDNMQLANAWLADRKTVPYGEPISVKEGDTYKIYTVGSTTEGGSTPTPSLSAPSAEGFLEWQPIK